jgi:hypothetical protein
MILVSHPSSPGRTAAPQCQLTGHRVFILAREYLDLCLHLLDPLALESQLLLAVTLLLLRVFQSLLESVRLRGRCLPLVLRLVKLRLQHSDTFLQVLVVLPLLLQKVNLILEVDYTVLVGLIVLLKDCHICDLLLVYFNDSRCILQCSDLLLFNIQFILYLRNFLTSLQHFGLLFAHYLSYPLIPRINLPLEILDRLHVRMHLLLAHVRRLRQLLLIYLYVLLQLQILDLALLELLSCHP